ncbi:MAG: circularly permuted type 2 ATP-grasp protein [Alphaproteobacteria bacterium]|nr:circularly permuted type 2 ATP-grasp protein [Alphaproteobacteria bacterium]
MVARRQRPTEDTESYTAGYRPIPGVADELLDDRGVVRPAWRTFIRNLDRLNEAEIARYFARGDQYLRDAGVFFRQYAPEGSKERAWPLSHVPVILDEEEWRELGEGLVQRANLLERVVADLYGPRTLVRDGYLPAALIAGSPEWLRPLVGIEPPSGHFLHFLAFDVGRGPDGKWWVLSDRTQAPSGTGFALENRVATSRVFPDAFGRRNVLRVASFFRRFRDRLTDLRGDPEDGVAILTPGILNDSYFEHAYIARYLGFMLLEGEDLIVEKGAVMVRTVEGLRPVSVLWRRLDAAFADPLELNDESQLGTPGLVAAVRSGQLTMVNALGTGILETRALLAFLPRIAEAVLGEPLALPNIATWWCGQKAERDHVRENLDDLVIGRALSTRPLFEANQLVSKEAYFEKAGDGASRFDREGAQLVGQEAVKLSTTPVFLDGRLHPRPVSVRLFLARSEDGWQVMPGGYARVGRTQDPNAITLQRGGSVADVWVVSDRPVDAESMLPAPAAPYIRAEPGILPSRAADNLYWLGRYVERAEFVMRLVRAYNARLIETMSAEGPLMILLAHHLEGFGVEVEEGVPQGLLDVIGSAIYSASRIRDRFSVDGWTALNDLMKNAQDMRERVDLGDDAASAMGVLLRKITGFSGLVHENMYRFNGWRFLSVGRGQERIICTTTVLARFADPKAPDGGLDLAVDAGDSAMSHRQRYSVATNRGTVIDLLALDSLNPRSILYQLSEIKTLVSDLPGAEVRGQLSPLSRAVLQAHTNLAIETPMTLTTGKLIACRDEVMAFSDTLTDSYLR